MWFSHGAGSLFAGCSNEAFDPKHTYTKLIASVLGILIMGLVDATLLRSRVDAAACEALMDGWCQYKTGLLEMSDKDVKSVRYRSGTLLSMFSRACDLGKKADDEPRSWSVASRKAALRHPAVGRAKKMTFCLTCSSCPPTLR